MMVMWVIVWGFGTVRDNRDMFNYDGDVGDSLGLWDGERQQRYV